MEGVTLESGGVDGHRKAGPTDAQAPARAAGHVRTKVGGVRWTCERPGAQQAPRRHVGPEVIGAGNYRHLAGHDQCADVGLDVLLVQQVLREHLSCLGFGSR